MSEELDIQPLTLGDVEVVSRPLRYEKAEDHLAEVTHFVATTIEHLVTSAPAIMAKIAAEGLAKADVAKVIPLLLPSVAHVAKKIADGNMLKRLAPHVLAATTVTMPNPQSGEREEYHLANVKDRATVFEAHPGLYYPILFHAGRVTFGPFFNVREYLANLLPKGR